MNKRSRDMEKLKEVRGISRSGLNDFHHGRVSALCEEQTLSVQRNASFSALVPLKLRLALLASLAFLPYTKDKCSL